MRVHPYTLTHSAENHPSPAAINFEYTTMCCWCCVCSAARAGAAADCWKQHAVKANTVQGGGQPVDWWDSVAHSGCGAQVLTCNYEPFIGHNVNYTAKEHTVHNAGLLNHNHLKENFCWCLQEPHLTQSSSGACGSEAEKTKEWPKEAVFTNTTSSDWSRTMQLDKHVQCHVANEAAAWKLA